MKSFEDLFPCGFNYSLLWQDPLQIEVEGGRQSPLRGAVLRAEIIKRYVEHDLIIDKRDFVEDNLKGASYSMVPARNEGWEVGADGAIKSLQTVKGEGNQDAFLVPANSLVFIRLKETLRLPFYLIARFNLKIRYVYQGLLLGTGPQIDPGYTGRIYIPLHNLTSEPVHILLETTFVSFDFERTTELVLEDGPAQNFDEFYDKYEHTKFPIDRPKLLERERLKDYLGTAKPHSSLEVVTTGLKTLSAEAAVSAAAVTTLAENARKELDDLSASIKSDAAEVRKEARNSKRFELLTAVGFVLALVGAFWGYYVLFHKEAVDMRDKVERLNEKLINVHADARVEFTKAMEGRLFDSQEQLKKMREDMDAQSRNAEALRQETLKLKEAIDKPTAPPERQN
jgi:deoxycytidine triphosphate deaminase